MIRSLLLLAVCFALPSTALAGPKEDAEAVFEEFLAAFAAADPDRVVRLFAQDALVWGTGMRDLATTPDEVRRYFSPISAGGPNRFRASTFGPFTALVLSEDAVLLSGMWQVEDAGDGTPAVNGPLRVSIAVVKRENRWLIAQFHNSRRPDPQSIP